MNMKKWIVLISLALIFTGLFCEEISKERQALITLANADTLFTIKKNYSLAVKEYEKSLTMFNEIKTDITPFNEEFKKVYFNLYAASVNGKIYDKAVIYGEQYLLRDSLNVSIVANLGKIYKIKLKDIPGAIKVWSKYDSINSTDESRLAIADLYYSSNDYSNALVWFNKVVKKDADLLDKIASTYIKTKQNDLAIKTYEEYLLTEPSSEDKFLTYRNMGKLYNDLKNESKAVENYSKAIEIKFDGKLALFIADKYFGKKDYENTLKYSEMILSNNASNPDGLYFKAVSNYNLGKKEDAKVDFKKIEKNPKYGASATSYIKLIDQGK